MIVVTSRRRSVPGSHRRWCAPARGGAPRRCWATPPSRPTMTCVSSRAPCSPRAPARTAVAGSHERRVTMTIHEVFADHSAVTARAALELPPVLERTVAVVHECLRAGGKILACGNGGSAADAQHLTAELVGRFREERQALAAIALTADTALLTALGNDY